MDPKNNTITAASLDLYLRITGSGTLRPGKDLGWINAANHPERTRTLKLFDDYVIGKDGKKGYAETHPSNLTEAAVLKLARRKIVAALNKLTRNRRRSPKDMAKWLVETQDLRGKCVRSNSRTCAIAAYLKNTLGLVSGNDAKKGDVFVSVDGDGEVRLKQHGGSDDHKTPVSVAPHPSVGKFVQMFDNGKFSALVA